jgi:hypothetical protein
VTCQLSSQAAAQLRAGERPLDDDVGAAQLCGHQPELAAEQSARARHAAPEGPDRGGAPRGTHRDEEEGVMVLRHRTGAVDQLGVAGSAPTVAGTGLLQVAGQGVAVAGHRTFDPLQSADRAALPCRARQSDTPQLEPASLLRRLEQGERPAAHAQHGPIGAQLGVAHDADVILTRQGGRIEQTDAGQGALRRSRPTTVEAGARRGGATCARAICAERHRAPGQRRAVQFRADHAPPTPEGEDRSPLRG